MSLQAPYYLATGSVVIEDGTASGPYALVRGTVSFPAPSERDDDTSPEPHDDAVRSFKVRCKETSAPAVKAAFNALSRACRKGGLLRFRDGETDDLLECRIIRGRVSEDSYDPLLRQRASGYELVASVTLVTEPYWHAPWSDEVTVADAAKSPSAVFPFFATVAAVGGDVDALLTATLLPTQITNMQALGVFPDAGTAFDPIDDYNTTVDANAYGGQKVTSASLTTTHTAIGSAPTLDTAGNRDAHILQVRAENTAAAVGTVTFKPRATTAGSGIATTANVDGAPVRSTRKTGEAFEVTTIGVVDVPSVEMPETQALTGYAAEAVAIQQNTDTSDYIITAGLANQNTNRIGQSFTPVTGHLVTAIEYTVGVEASPQDDAIVRWLLYVYEGSGGDGAIVSSVALTAADLEVGLHKIAIPPFVASGVYTLALGGTRPGAVGATIGLAHSNTGSSTYAGGTLWASINGTFTAVTTKDLTFKVYTQTPYAFLSSTPVLAACSESNKTASLDVVTRIPTGCGAFVCTKNFGAGEGIRFDGDKRRGYHADADGIGNAVLAQTRLFGFPRLRPGVVNAIVVNAYTPAAAAPQGGVLKYSYRERYLNAVRD